MGNYVHFKKNRIVRIITYIILIPIMGYGARFLLTFGRYFGSYIRMLGEKIIC